MQVDCGSPAVLLGGGGVVLEHMEVLERLGLHDGPHVRVPCTPGHGAIGFGSVDDSVEEPRVHSPSEVHRGPQRLLQQKKDSVRGLRAREAAQSGWEFREGVHAGEEWRAFCLTVEAREKSGQDSWTRAGSWCVRVPFVAVATVVLRVPSCR